MKRFLDACRLAVKQGIFARKVLEITPEDRRTWLSEYLESQSARDRDASMDSVP